MEIIIGSEIFNVGITTENKSKTIRNKGKSKLFFPDDYTLLDLETTGYDPRWDRIIEIGALKVRNKEVVDKTTCLIKYSDDNSIPSQVESLTGINETMIRDKGIDIKDSISNLLNFINNDLIVGFNVNFDINFLYDAVKKYFGKDLSNDYVDVLRIARKFYPSERHNRLYDCMERVGIKEIQSHRGLSDCYDTKLILDYFENNSDNDLLLQNHKHYKHSKFDLSSLKADRVDFDKGNPFYMQNVCFTGKLDNLLRKEAAQLVVNLGGSAQNGITSKTDYLILGDTAYSLHNKGQVTSKLKKAHEMIDKGYDLKIINENVFIDMINDRLHEVKE